MRLKFLFSLTVTLAVASPAIASTSALWCDASHPNITSGQHQGRITGVIVRNDWDQSYINFVFRDDHDSLNYSIRQNISNSNIVNIAMRAFILSGKVKIQVEGDRWFTKVGFQPGCLNFTRNKKSRYMASAASYRLYFQQRRSLFTFPMRFVAFVQMMDIWILTLPFQLCRGLE